MTVQALETEENSMSSLDALRDSLPDAARDIKVNLQNVLAESTLTEAQRWGTAIACAYASKNASLAEALIAEGKADANTVDDARAAAILMGMNNVFYRFKHVMGKESYSSKPARLRMTRIAKPASTKLDFELFCLAVSAVNFCEACIKAHEKTVLDGGMSEDNVFDAVRIAATVHAVATGMLVASTA
jgi:alkyl hydroperoxide reductase subunit D